MDYEHYYSNDRSGGKSAEKLSKLYSSIDENDSAKMLEIKEIELEEFYIQKLKEQRQKMELLKDEFDKKNQIIEEKDYEIQNKTLQIRKLESKFQESIQAMENYKSNYDQYSSFHLYKTSRVIH